jgi:hypothetical protein
LGIRNPWGSDRRNCSGGAKGDRWLQGPGWSCGTWQFSLGFDVAVHIHLSQPLPARFIVFQNLYCAEYALMKQSEERILMLARQVIRGILHQLL